MRSWRKHVPNDCPPEDAHANQITVYRLINGESPTAHDFLSYKEEGRGFDDECIASGLSVYTEMAGIEALKRKIKKLKDRKVIAGTFQSDWGVLKNTPSNLHLSHHTWWLSRFQVVNPTDSEQ
jgi:hypothetical protein